MNFAHLKTALLSLMAAATLAGAQGQLYWANRSLPEYQAPVYGVDPHDPFTPRTGNSSAGLPSGTQTYGGPLLEGTGFTAALFVDLTPEAVRGSLSAVDMRPFRTGSGAGYILVRPDDVDVPGIGIGTLAYVQMRAWDNQGGLVTSWAQVLADGTVPRGESDVITLVLGGPPPPGSPGPPNPVTTGLRSFSLHIVPEPSILGFSLLLALTGFGFRRNGGSNS